MRVIVREFFAVSNEPGSTVMEEVRTTILELISRFVESISSLDLDLDFLHHIDFQNDR